MRTLKALLTFGAIAAASNASALVIDPTNWGGCIGSSSCTIGAATVSSDPTNLRMAQKTVAGETGLGIRQTTRGEIDIDQHINITFNETYGHDVNSIRLLFLYNGPEFSDVAEIAQITGTDIHGVSTTYSLSMGDDADNTGGLWNGEGLLSQCGATVKGDSGCFDLSNPFGDTRLASLSFTALTGSGAFSGSGTNESDFSIGSVKSVPEPGTLALLGLGLAGLGIGRRHARS